MTVYVEGQNIRLDFALVDLDGDPVNAGSGFPVLVLREHGNTGSGTAYIRGANPEISVLAGSGLYQFNSVAVSPGQYDYEWKVDGAAPARKRGTLRVIPELPY